MNTDFDREQVLCHLIQAMLDAALHGKAYPGQKTPVALFPDIEIVKDLDEIVISDRNLGAACQLLVRGYQIIVLSDDEITARASSKGDFPYFTLTETEIHENEALLSLRLSWAISEESKKAGKMYLGGGGTRVRFEQKNGEWLAPSGPIATWMA